jgi:hypothetical protein
MNGGFAARKNTLAWYWLRLLDAVIDNTDRSGTSTCHRTEPGVGSK